MIELKQISKTYVMGDTTVNALLDISIKIDDGDFVAIMGPSGSGKSTLMHILGLLDVPTQGSYLLNGKEVSKLSEDQLAVERRESVGFIFQQFNLLPRMEAWENVSLPLLYSKGTLDYKKAISYLNQVQLGERSTHKPNELSGGQQQRVAIARSLVNSPKVILADEPTGNLDSVSEREILSVLKDLNSKGITVIIVTHEEGIAAQAKRIIRLRDGKIQSITENESTDARTVNSKDSFQQLKDNEKNKNLHLSLIKSFWNGKKEVFEHFKQGYRTLAANKIRTALSMLGILIGVAAVVAMLALGKGAQKAIEKQLSSLGSNLLVLRAGAMRVGGVFQESGSTTRLTVEDSQTLKEKIPGIKAVAASVNGRGQVTFQDKNWSTSIAGVTPSYANIHAAVPKVGRFFTEEENLKRSRVAVLGATVVRELFENQNPIGEMIKINKINFQVIGVLPEKGATGWRDQDDIIIMPVFTAMHRLLGKDYVDSIDIEVNDAKLMDAVEDAGLSLMYVRHRVPVAMREDAFQIRNMAEIQSAVAESNQTMSLLLASIAAISLLVGGIGIMNIMLVSVTERTKEIGLRKAIGARKKDILLQFLSESVVVSVVGGASGILLGWLITLTLTYFSGWQTYVTPDSIFLAFFFSAFIGILFGIYPARKASMLHPIDALRYE